MNQLVDRCPWCDTTITRTKFLEIEGKIREQEQKKVAEAEVLMRKRLEGEFQRDLAKQRLLFEKNAQEQTAKQVSAITNERDQLTVKLKAAETNEKAFRLQAAQEAERQDRDETVLKERAGFTRERESWEKKLKELEHKLQRKTTQEMGDGAEIDLYEVLRSQFPGDKIVRIKKGQPGADILHEVLYKGESCGRIVMDSKNRQQWKKDFVSKLRQDQTEASAEHAVLSTTIFPTGKKELCLESDVIIVSPARACHIISLLRRSMITVHVKGLSMKERAGKMSRLYKFISSEAYAQRFAELARLTNDILDLDVQEKKSHDNVWKKRGGMATRLNHVLREIDTDVSGIIEAHEESELSAAS